MIFINTGQGVRRSKKRDRLILQQKEKVAPSANDNHSKQYLFIGVIQSVQSSIYCGGLDGFLLSNPPSVAQNEREGGINASVPTHPAIHTWPSEDAVKKYYHISTFQIDKLRTGKYSMMNVKALFYW